ncbi:pol polyprotein [Tanacetum coccineum]
MFLTSHTLGLRVFLKETALSLNLRQGLSSNVHAVQAVEAWKHSDFLCHNYVPEWFGGSFVQRVLQDSRLPNNYGSHLERKTRTEDCGTKTFGMALSETFQVATITEKLPPSWRQQAGSRKTPYTPDSARIIRLSMLVFSRVCNSKGNNKEKKKNDKKGKGKAEYLAHKAGIVKQKFQGTCYNCDQPGHRAANCKMPKRVNPRQANNGATRPCSADKSMFHSFRAVDNGHKLFMGNSATADIKGERDVILKMTSEKELKLTNVLYVPKIRKNLVSLWLLNKFGFR